MPGSGKGVFVEVARNDYNLPVYTMGDVVREEALKRYGSAEPEHVLRTSIKLREEQGQDVIARRVYEEMDKGSNVVVVDGVRSLHEVEFFKSKGEVVVVAIHAPPRVRFERLLARNRPDDPKSWSEFKRRDEIELSLGVGSVIALADYVLINDSSVERAREEARRTLAAILSGASRA